MAISGRECSGLVRSTHMPLTILNVSYPLATVSDETAGGAEPVLAILGELSSPEDTNLWSLRPQDLVVADTSCPSTPLLASSIIKPSSSLAPVIVTQS